MKIKDKIDKSEFCSQDFKNLSVSWKQLSLCIYTSSNLKTHQKGEKIELLLQ